MRSSDCMKSSSGGSRPRPCCLPRKLPRCCSGPCWLLARSRCARWTAGRASPKSQPIRSLTSPPDAVTSSRWRSRRNKFQHKSRRHQHHEYELYLAAEDIDHSRTKTKSPQTNGIAERFHKTVLDEFYRIAFRKKLYASIEELQNDLDLWVKSYNEERH